MFSKVFLLTILPVFVLGITQPSYQEGIQVGPAWSAEGNHILQTGNAFERSIDVSVTFIKPFENLPEIAAAPCIWDFQTLVPVGFSFSIQSITKKDFIARIKALTTRQIYTYKFNWLAIDDPRVHIEYFEISKPPQLSEGKADRQFVVQVPAKDWDFRLKEGVKVVPFLVGFQITQGDTITLFIKLKNYENGQASISLSTSGDTLVQKVQLCVVFSNYEKMFITDTMGQRPIPSHSWHTGLGDRYEELTAKLPSQLLSGPRASLGGFTGFDLPIDKKNCRIVLQKVSIGSKTVSGKYGTWGDTEVNQITFQILVYQSDDWPIFSQECAELFSECQFKGSSFKICTNSKNIKGEGFKGPVRSVWIPKGRVLKLYNQVDLAGQDVILTQTEECIDHINFQFVQFTEKI